MFAPQTLGFTFPQALRYDMILAYKNALEILISRETSLLEQHFWEEGFFPKDALLKPLSFPHFMRFL